MSKAKFKVAEAFDTGTGETVMLLVSAKTGRVEARECYGCGGHGCYECENSGWI